MGFGKKGLAPGQAAAQPSGFGHAPRPVAQAATPAQASQPELVQSSGSPAGDADIAAKREAFVAAERARKAEQGQSGSVSGDPMAGLHNSVRPAQKLPAQRLGELGVASNASARNDPKEQLRAEARKMAAGNSGGSAESASQRPVSSSAGQKKFLFGDPAKRSVLLAYVLWWFASVLSIHRFYCGSSEGAIYQLGMLFASLIILAIFPIFGVVGLCLWFGWIFLDLFLMPGMMKKFKAEHAQPDYAHVFE